MQPRQTTELKKTTKFLILSFITFFFLSLVLDDFISQANPLTSTIRTIQASGLVQYPTNATSTRAFWLHTQGTKILNAANEEVVFNGVSTMVLFGYEPPTYPPATMTYDESRMDEVRQHGLNLIRLDVSFSSSVYGIPASQQTPTSLTYNSGFFPYLDRLVNECAKVGVWVNICFAMNSMSPIGGAWSSAVGAGVGFPVWMYNGSWSYFNKIYPNTSLGLSAAIRDFWNINNATTTNLRTAYQAWWKDVAYHFRNTPNVIFGLWNEPQSGGGETIWGGTGQPTQEQGAQMYKTFMEQTIDIIQSVAPDNLIFQNDAYFWLWKTNPKIDRPNVVVENHAYTRIDPFTDPYGNNPTGDVMYFVNLGRRYNQPFFLGEFGGIEEGSFQDRNGTIANMRFCNSLNVSWSYLSFRPFGGGWNPSAQTWADLQNNLNPYLIYYRQAG
jgi:hypothetical protein